MSIFLRFSGRAGTFIAVHGIPMNDPAAPIAGFPLCSDKLQGLKKSLFFS
jgi:hypothetical protein